MDQRSVSPRARRARRPPLRRHRLGRPDGGTRPFHRERRPAARQGLQDARRQGRRPVDQLARRLARAVGPDRPAYPPAGHREQADGDRLRRGRGGLGRLLARLCGRRDRGRPGVDRGLDRRDLLGLRLRRTDRAPWHPAPRAYVGREQVDARPLPAREARGRRAAEAAAERDPRRLQGLGARAPRRAPQGRRGDLVHRRVLDRHARPRVRPRRCARRTARHAPAALWRESAPAGDPGATSLPVALRPGSRDGDRAIDQIGVSTLAAIEERAHWQRFGL